MHLFLPLPHRLLSPNKLIIFNYLLLSSTLSNAITIRLLYSVIGSLIESHAIMLILVAIIGCFGHAIIILTFALVWLLVI